MSQEKMSSETGSAVMEVAVSFPFLALMIMAIGLVAWIFWVQAAAHIATLEAARSAAFHRGSGNNIGEGHAPFQAALVGLTNTASTAAVGSPQIEADWNRRSVTVSIDGRISYFTNVLGDSYQFTGGAFTRIQNFFGGPPDPWE